MTQVNMPARKLHRISEDSPDAVNTTAQTIKPAHKMDRILYIKLSAILGALLRIDLLDLINNSLIEKTF